MILTVSIPTAFAQHGDGETSPLVARTADPLPIQWWKQLCKIRPSATNSGPDAEFEAGMALIAELKKVPGLGPLLKDYEDILRPAFYHGRVDGSNYGLRSYIDSIQEHDSRFRSTLFAFYRDLRSKAPDTHPASIADFKRDLTKAPHLGVKTKNPGWVWKLAIQHAKGDPFVAMRLIGTCGHDDVEQAFRFKAATIDDIRECKDSQIRACENGQASDKLERALGMPDANANTDDSPCVPSEVKAGDDCEFECPAWNSGFYLPQTLGREADISEELKLKISEIHGKSKKPVFFKLWNVLELTPAKAYHIYGSAFVACEMLKRGHPAPLVTKLQELLAWAYRTSSVQNYYCLDHAPTNQYDKDKYPDASTDLDASFLMRKWTLAGSMISAGPLKLRIPVTNAHVEIPSWLEDQSWWNSVQKPRDWSEDRFSKAKARLKLIWSDWDWTVAQHKAGAEFAAAHCKKGESQK